MPRVYADGSTKHFSSRPHTAPTSAMHTSATIVDLTGEPDSDEEKRLTKKPRIGSVPAVPIATTTPPVASSTPQAQEASATATPADQAPPAENEEDISLDWLNMDGHPPTESNGDVQMGSPAQEAQQIPMDVVQQAQTLLEGPPPAGPPQIGGMQQSDQSAPPASGDQTSQMQTDEQPTQESLSPSPEIIQQCIDENFVDFQGDGLAGGTSIAGARMCRMCQYVLHPPFIPSPPHRYSRPVAGSASSGDSRTRRRRRSRRRRARRSSRGIAGRSTPGAGSCCSRDVWKTMSLMRTNRGVLLCLDCGCDASPTRRVDSGAGVVCGATYLVRMTFGGSCLTFGATQFHI